MPFGGVKDSRLGTLRRPGGRSTSSPSCAGSRSRAGRIRSRSDARRLREAVAELVHDGDVVALEGFTHLIPHAAGHELIRQGRRDLTLVRMTPDVDLRPADRDGLRAQARVLVGRQPGRRLAAPLPRRRRARLAGAARARRALARGDGGGVRGRRGEPAVRRAARLRGGDLAAAHARRTRSTCPFTGEELAAVPAHRPDVGIVHAQQADRRGNVQLWGILGVQKEAVLASARSIVTVEEIVDELEPRPGAIVLPSWVVDAVARRARRRASRRTRTATTSATTTSTSRGMRSAATATASATGCSDTCSTRPTSASTTRRSRPTVAAGVNGTATRADEMMAVEAARRLDDGTVCFVGIGLPSLAANLARRTHAPGCVLVYESGTIGAKPAAAAALDRRRRARRDRGRRRLGARDVRVLAAGRPHRRRLPRRGADRPAREPQQHRDRRLRQPEGAPPGRRRRAGDRHVGRECLRDAPPLAARLRRASSTSRRASATTSASSSPTSASSSRATAS